MGGMEHTKRRLLPLLLAACLAVTAFGGPGALTVRAEEPEPPEIISEEEPVADVEGGEEAHGGDGEEQAGDGEEHPPGDENEGENEGEEQPGDQPVVAPVGAPVTPRTAPAEVIKLDEVMAGTITGGPGWSKILDGRANLVELTGPGPYELTGSMSDIGVRVGYFGGPVAVVLNGVTINANGMAAFNCNGASVEITLVGSSTLKSGGNCAGLQCGGSVTIDGAGSGSLTATGGNNGAGIGAGFSTHYGDITIANCTVIATGIGAAAGIGGGMTGSGGDITIIASTVTATGGSFGGTGIGTATQGASGDITIIGGVVYATGGSTSPDIGSSKYEVSTTGGLTVSGGARVYLQQNGSDSYPQSFTDCIIGGAGAGSLAGRYDENGEREFAGRMIDMSNPDDTGANGWIYNSTNTVTISGGGSGEEHYYIYGSTDKNRIAVTATAPVTVTLAGVDIDLDSSYVDSAGAAAFDCGPGDVTMVLEGNNVLKGVGQPGLKCETDASVTIGGTGRLEATGGSYSAGIGGGDRGDGGEITITGGDVKVAGGDGGGVGIGAGTGGSGGSLKLTGNAVVRAAGGDSGYAADGNQVDGGDGLRADNLDIALEGGRVEATGGDGSGLESAGHGIRAGQVQRLTLADATLTATGGDNTGSGASGHGMMVGSGDLGVTLNGGTLAAGGGSSTGTGAPGTGLQANTLELTGAHGALTATGGSPGGAGLPAAIAITNNNGFTMEGEPGDPVVTFTKDAPVPSGGSSTRGSGSGVAWGGSASAASTPLPVGPQSQTWSGGPGGLTFTVEGVGPIALTGVFVNGTPLEPEQYGVREGSVILTLKSSYLQTLPTGSYELRLTFWSGTASATFNIQAAPAAGEPPENTAAGEPAPATTPGDPLIDTHNPGTGAHSTADAWIGVLITAAGAAAWGRTGTKRREKQR